MRIAALFELLTAYRAPGVFNQYAQVDPTYDQNCADELRRHNLRRYLRTFANAEFLLIGEAAGYRGCRFTGIPFTSETQLVGPDRLQWAVGQDLASTSRTDQPWTEQSSTIVWEALGGRGDVVMWNAFPWHPFGKAGALSNRSPRRQLHAGQEVLCAFLDLFSHAEPYAVGRVAERALQAVGVRARYIRHPAYGGKKQFKKGIDALSQISDQNEDHRASGAS